MYPTLFHYSKDPMIKLHNREQGNELYKPNGLWVSVEDGDGWRAWCEDQQFNLCNFNYTTELCLKENAKVLWLKNSKDILLFSEKYSKNAYYIYNYIEWAAVAEEYQGVIIAPYNWSLRLCSKTHWYYGWDCSSGCLWDAECVRNIKCYSTQVLPHTREEGLT